MKRKKPRILSLFGVIFAAIIIVAAGAALGGLTGAAPARGMGRVTGRATGVVINVPAPTGVPETDWENIQIAIDSAQPGDTVQLAAGHYKIHRILLRQPLFNGLWGYGAPFNATIQGKGKHDTIIEAVRSSQDVGFEAPGYYSEFPSILEIDVLEGLTLKDMTMQVLRPDICDTYVNYWGETTQSLFVIANAVEGDHFDTTIENVRMLGAPAVPGDEAGPYNTGFLWEVIGNFSNWASSGTHKILNSEFENCSWYGIVVEQLTDSNTIIDCITVKNAELSGLVYQRQTEPHTASVTHSTFEGGTQSHIRLQGASNTTIRENIFDGGVYDQIRLQGASNTTITGNTFKNFTGHEYWNTAPIYVRNDNHDCIISGNEFININGATTAIFVRGLNNINISIICNDYRQSNLPGWTATGSGGPGCVLLDWNTEDNIVAECLFPEGTTASEQILDLGKNHIFPCSALPIIELVREVESLIEAGKLKESKGNGLIAKLNEAMKNLAKNKPNERVACNKLSDFIDQVNAYLNSGILSPEDGQPLIDAANKAINDLCG